MCLRASIMYGLWRLLSPLADASRIIPRAMGTIKRFFLWLPYTLFCLLCWRRCPRFTVCDEARLSVSSRNVSPFTKMDEESLFKGLPTHVNRLIQRRSLASLPRAVCLRQRRSNNAYMGSMISRSLRR
jgi:hypothetical protein